jgi:hypothetical protein
VYRSEFKLGTSKIDGMHYAHAGPANQVLATTYILRQAHPGSNAL